MLNDFIQKHQGTLVSFDGVPEHAGDNMQLIAAWCKYIGMPFRWPLPKDWLAPRDDDSFKEYWKFGYQAAEKPLPSPGDIVIFDDNMPGSDGIGHASIFVEWSGSNWTGFDADWEGEAAHLQEHNWLFIRGWFTPVEPRLDRPVKTSMYERKSGIVGMATPYRIGDSKDTILINDYIPRYGSMSAAMAHLDTRDTVPIHQYYVYRRLNGMMHLTRELGQPQGIWINPVDLEPKPEPVIEVDTPPMPDVTEVSITAPPERVYADAAFQRVPHTPSLPVVNRLADDWELPYTPHRTAEIRTHYGRLFLKMLKSSQVMKTIKDKYKEL